MLVTVFRSRLNPEIQEEYQRWAVRMSALLVCHSRVFRFTPSMSFPRKRESREYADGLIQGWLRFSFDMRYRIDQLYRCIPGSPPSRGYAEWDDSFWADWNIKP
jgi:hypothetical protein